MDNFLAKRNSNKKWRECFCCRVFYGNNPAPSTAPVNFEGTIVFPTPKLVYTDIYMVGVPYFLEEILSIEPPTLRRQKKHGDPNSTMSSVRNLLPVKGHGFMAGNIAC
jgi:hypothetical protein